MILKMLLLVFVLSIFAVHMVHSEDVSAVLKKPNIIKSNRFTTAGKDYYVGDLYKTNFYKALQFCRRNKMQLLSINNQQESDWIEKSLTMLGLTSGHYWTSGSNHGDGKWVWLSTGVDIVYTNWYPGEPSGNTSRNVTENCLELRYLQPSGYKWNDSPCLDEAFFICESTTDCV